MSIPLLALISLLASSAPQRACSVSEHCVVEGSGPSLGADHLCRVRDSPSPYPLPPGEGIDSRPLISHAIRIACTADCRFLPPAAPRILRFGHTVPLRSSPLALHPERSEGHPSLRAAPRRGSLRERVWRDPSPGGRGGGVRGSSTVPDP
jgi:hypothetical protein